MSKAPKYIRERREEDRKTVAKRNTQERLSKTWLQRAFTGWKIVGELFGVAGALLTVLSLYPRISVNAQPLSDPRDPLSAPFVITNDGYLPFYSIEYALHLTKLIDANGQNLNSKYPMGMFIMAGKHPTWEILKPGDTATIIPHPIHSPDINFPVPLRLGEMEVVVGYRYGIWPFRKQRRYVFSAMTAAGETMWMREPRAD